MSDIELRRQLDHLARRVCAMVDTQPGRLVALHLRAPRGIDEMRVRSVLEPRLADSGLDFVEIRVRDHSPAIFLETAEFER